MNCVFVVSDGTGETAEQVVQAALAQFSGPDVKIECRSKVRTEKKIHEIVHQAAKAGGFIVHTFVLDHLREAVLKIGREHNVETIDLMGPLLERLSYQLAISPSEKPGLFRQLNETYFRRIETMEFAIQHDDGMNLGDLKKAEIVLVGVSRTFKTPLSIYLAFKGWFVANIPIVLDIKPPPVLLELPEDSVFGLTTHPERLAQLRKMRQDFLGGPSDYYSESDYVRKEIKYALSFFNKKTKWPVIDVTNKSIEEISSEILTLKSSKK